MKKLIFTILILILALVPSVCSAATTVPSVEAKQAPELVAQTDKDGNECAAVIIDKDGNIVQGLGWLEVIITPLAEADNAPLIEIRDELKEAYIQIQSANDLGELTEGIIAALEQFKKTTTNSYYKDANLDTLVVSDLFDVTVVGNGVEILKLEGFRIMIRIKTTIKPGEMYFVLHNLHDDYWEVVEDTDLAEDGTLTFIAEDLSPFAIVREHHDYDTPGGEDSETTHKGCCCRGKFFCLCWCWWYGFITGIILMLLIILIVKCIKKLKEMDEDKDEEDDDTHKHHHSRHHSEHHHSEHQSEHYHSSHQSQSFDNYDIIDNIDKIDKE